MESDIENGYNEFNIKTVKNLFYNIEKKIKENVGLFFECIEKDNNNLIERFDYSRIKKTIDRINSEEWIIEKNINANIYCGIGNIGACIKGKPDILLYLILKALKTNNNIVLFEEEIHETSKMIVDIINKECEKIGYNKTVKLCKYNSITDIVDGKFNIVIFINELQKYLDFSSRKQNVDKIIYSNYGTMDLYLEDKSMKEELIATDDFIYKNEIEIEIHKNKDIKEVVKNINICNHNYCAVIFTKNKEYAYYFIKNVKAEKIFVNKNPKNDYEFTLKDEELILDKEIFI